MSITIGGSSSVMNQIKADLKGRHNEVVSASVASIYREILIKQP